MGKCSRLLIGGFVMEKFKEFLKRKDIVISAKRYGIDALSAMAQGLFCSLLIGTIINTIGTQFHIAWLTTPVANVGGIEYTVGGLATAMSGPAMAVAIGRALNSPPLVLFSLITAGFASNALGGAGGPLAVLFVTIITAEIGKAVAGETKIDILVTPLITIAVGVALSALLAPPLGALAMKVGNIIMWATELQPFLMGILVSVVVNIGKSNGITLVIYADINNTAVRIGECDNFLIYFFGKLRFKFDIFSFKIHKCSSYSICYKILLYIIPDFFTLSIAKVIFL